MRRSEARPVIANYARERLRAELAEKPRGARTALAKELGVTKSAITGFLGTAKSAPRGAGEDLLALLATHWNETPASLEQKAIEAATKSAGLVPYPHRREAARICLDGGLSPEAVKQVLEEEADFVSDPPVFYWIKVMMHAAEKLSVLAAMQTRARKASA